MYAFFEPSNSEKSHTKRVLALKGVMQMNRFVRGLLAGGLVGATVGAALILRSSHQTQDKIRARTKAMGNRASSTAREVASRAMRIGNSISSNTASIARRFSRSNNEAQP